MCDALLQENLIVVFFHKFPEEYFVCGFMYEVLLQVAVGGSFRTGLVDV